MRILRNLKLTLLCLFGSSALYAQQTNITPVPVDLVYVDADALDIDCALKLYVDRALSSDDAEHLVAALERGDIDFKTVKRPASRMYLNLLIDNEVSANEGYRLVVASEGVTIAASTPAGLFYGIQSLNQMAAGAETLPCVEIEDYPRFSYRGVLIDISRHFRTKEFIMRQIDMMAQMKMNRLHLHLTDAAGWRIEVDAYPALCSYAAWRTPATWKEWWYGDRKYVEEGSEGAYGGYLTKEEARELVEYASERYVTIIPEIEMPGHSDEVLAAYPHLKCTTMPEHQGDLCIGKEATFHMMQAILDEIIEIFPSEYIHIGGDEAGKSSWSECLDCQRRMKQEGLTDVDELQSYMIHRIEEYLNSKGRQIIGWDEILQGGLAPNATVMSWRGEEGGREAAAMGHNVVMSPHGYCYIDAPQDAPQTQPESIGGYLPLRKVYSYEPIPETMSEDVARYILGVQANLWAEFIFEDDHYEMMLWPRAIAVAEIGWSQPEDRCYDEFHRRALIVVERMQQAGYKPFDLKNEIGDRPESLQPVEHLAVGKSVSYIAPSFYFAP